MRQRLILLGLWVLCIGVCLIALAWMLAAIVAGSARAWVLAVAHDQLGNAATGGSEDETVSSRAHRARLAGRRWGCVLCRMLDALDPDHCRKSYEDEVHARRSAQFQGMT